MIFGNTVVCPKCGGTVQIVVAISMLSFMVPTLHKFWVFGCQECTYRLIHSGEDDILPDRWFNNYVGHMDMDEEMAEEIRRLID